MNFRRGKTLLLICCTVFALTMTATRALAQAPASLFQLDGNSAQTGGYPCGAYTAPCDYMNLINGTGSSGSGVGHSAVNSFILGTSSTLNFQTGGSKDPNLISSWAYASTNTPNKDTLNAGYAAAYSISDFDLIFGADRLSPNGDANIGIWFFQDTITTNGTGGFNGAHKNGDLFVISAFTGGGGTSAITVYPWEQPGLLPNLFKGGCASGVKNPVPGDCADTNLLLVASPATVCGASNYCAITNSGAVTATWATMANGYSVANNSLASPLFFEGGIDVTAALASVGINTVPCFGSFLEETRSSQSTTAVLKDFLLGSLPVCKIKVTKTYTCNTFNPDDTFNYSYTGTVTNSGVGEVFNVQVTDTPAGGSPRIYTCGDLVKGASATFPGTCSSASPNTFTTATHPASNVADASACSSPLVGGICTATLVNATTGSVASSDANPGVSCTPHPDIAVTKRCVTAFESVGSDIVVRVDYTGEVTNTGTLNLSQVNVTDDSGGGPFGPFTLAPNQSICYTNGVTVSAGPPATGCPTLTVTDGLSLGTPSGAASYLPSSANVLGLTLGRIQFTDTVTATGQASGGSSVGPAVHSAMCVICPMGACATQ